MSRRLYLSSLIVLVGRRSLSHSARREAIPRVILITTLVDLINCSEQWEEVSIKLLSTELAFLYATKGRPSQLKKMEIDVREDLQ